MTDTTLGLTVQPDGTRGPKLDLPFRYARDAMKPAAGILRGVVAGACIWGLAAITGWMIYRAWP